MFPFRPTDRPRHVLRLLALLTGFFGGTLRAKIVDYTDDPTLSVTTVNVGKLNLRPVSLAEIFTIIETETAMKLAYPGSAPALGMEVILENDGVISLAKLFGMVSAQKDLEFERSGTEIAVRTVARADSDPVARGERAFTADRATFREPNATAARVVFAPAAPLAVATADGAMAADRLAASVGDIISGGSSRSGHEKKIAAVVRSSVTAATARLDSGAEALEVAVAMVRAAAASAPKFAETIVNAVVFAPGQTAMKSGAARLRAAAYAGARAPRGPSAATPVGYGPPAARSGVVKVPAGQTPGSFFSASPAPAEPAPAGVSPDPLPAAEPAPRAEGTFSAARSEAAAPASNSGFSMISAPAIELPAAGTSSAGAGTVGADGVVTMEKFGVQGAAVRNSQIALRQRATVSADVITSRDFSRFIATDIADIVIRMPGLSTTSRGSFAVVRGLAERYNPVMLDGIVMPSSDPERQSPELDIFPSRLVDAIVISKAYEPGLPGTSSGAGIDMRSKPIPEGRFAQVQFGLKFDEGYIKDDLFLGSASGGKWDLLAMGVKDRLAQRPATRPEMLDYVRASSTENGIASEKFPLGGRFSFTYENRLVLNDQAGRSLGYGISVGYDRTASSEQGERASIGGIFNTLGSTTDAAALGKFSTGSFDFTSRDFYESELEHRFGLLGTVGFAFNPRHTVALSAFWSQIGTDVHALNRNGLNMGGLYSEFVKARAAVASPAPFTVVLSQGNILDRDTGFFEIYYRQRRLTNLHLSGESKFGAGDSTKVSWTLAKLDARQQEPEYLNFPFAFVRPTFYSAGFGSGNSYVRYWRDTQESSKVGRLDAEYKFDLGSWEDTVLKAGVYIDRTERDYLEGAFGLNGGGAQGSSLAGLAGELRTYTRDVLPFDPSNFPPFADGDRSLDAGHVSITLPIAKNRPGLSKLEVMLGARYENYNLTSVGLGRVFNEASGGFYGQLARLQKQTPPNPNQTFAGNIRENKVLPAAAVSYSPIKPLTLRFSASKTTARPSFREFGSYFTIDRVSDEFVHGNFQLVTSDVTNFDFRAEYFFPKSRDLLALSLFTKKIENPIERLSFQNNNLGSVSTFANNRNSADLRGLEFEAAKNLGFLGEIGSRFTLGGNFTYLDAEVGRDPFFESRQIASPGIADTRTLYDQPKWIVNAYLSFEHRPAGFSGTVSWFGISDVLQKVNEFTWDSYTASYGRLDLTLNQRIGAQWQVRLAAKNLTDPDREFIADPNSTSEKFVYRRFSDGRDYSVTATYDF